MAVRKIRRFDDEILRKRSRDVEVIDDRINEILNDMVDTMYKVGNCGGLAACQIGILKRLVVIDVDGRLFKLINPKIIKSSGKEIVVEGCLSFPDIWGKVKRPNKVVVSALDENGKCILITGTDILAQCLCHEIEHLDGILFNDKIIEYVDIDK